MEKAHKIGLGLFALLTGAGLVAMQPEPVRKDVALDRASLRLASLKPSARRDVDYRKLDQRLSC